LICIVSLFCLMLGGCAATGTNREVYVVQPQDTLYSIAWRYNLDYRDLARWNQLGADFRITVGQTLVLTPAAETSSFGEAPPFSDTIRPAAAARGHAGGTSSSAPSSASGSTAASPAASGSASALKWVWPTDRLSPPQPVQGGGILLSGRMGQDVRAACAGRVVYTGSGLRGYGNLIIIKHGENLLSAYAHNRESLVTDGQSVAVGQVIGHMGEGAPQKPVLYFEIRRNGKPVDVAGFLPW
jgi:lipoprotein NlpD